MLSLVRTQESVLPPLPEVRGREEQDAVGRHDGECPADKLQRTSLGAGAGGSGLLKETGGKLGKSWVSGRLAAGPRHCSQSPGPAPCTAASRQKGAGQRTPVSSGQPVTPCRPLSKLRTRSVSFPANHSSTRELLPLSRPDGGERRAQRASRQVLYRQK